MTGEVTLTGQVLPIGGLKEKALAAQRSGLTRVIAPAENEADADDVPAHLRDDLEFVFVRDVGEVLDAALSRGARANGRVYAGRRSRKATRGK
jgi:ATP-dependent Lon protease